MYTRRVIANEAERQAQVKSLNNYWKHWKFAKVDKETKEEHIIPLPKDWDEFYMWDTIHEKKDGEVRLDDPEDVAPYKYDENKMKKYL
mmetsp:Transcript_782/g.1215  ORF Transcript_782/g.1215 Transcript_782/m.1215 type:complete len:88 (+) Transcript_782:85-348(+)